jgi:hypothetical protein
VRAFLCIDRAIEARVYDSPDVIPRTSDKTSEPSFIENDLESAEDEEEDDRPVNLGYGEAEDERRLELDNAPQTPLKATRRRRLDDLAATRSAKKQKR